MYGGGVEKGRDKLCGRHRQYLAGFDATPLLWEAARLFALEVVHLIKPYCSEKDYNNIYLFLNTGAAARAAEAAARAAEAAAGAARAAARAAAKERQANILIDLIYKYYPSIEEVGHV